ncbi:MAG TPA: DUF559 domain-containing protein [Actinomycetota bacterium]
MRRDIDALAARLAERQHGVFARAQIQREGGTKSLMKRRVAAGLWKAVAPEVFRLRGARPSWHQRVMTRCLSWGEGAVASHSAAAGVWEFAGFRPGPVDVTVPRGRRRSGRPVGPHWARLDPDDVTVSHGIPVTTPARTLVDLAGTVPLDKLEVALDDALRRRLTSTGELRHLLKKMSRRAGSKALRALLNEREGRPVPGSPFETMLLRAMKEAGLPDPVRQHSVVVDGVLAGILDFALLPERVAVEADGYEHHAGRARFDHDRSRRNRLTVAGWLVVHVTYPEFKRSPDAVIETIRRALHLRRQGGAP